MLVYTLGIACVVLLGVQMFLWNRRFKVKVTHGKKPLPPGSMGWPFVGETLEFFIKGLSSFCVKRFARYGNVYKTHLLGSPTIRVSGSHIIHDLISKEPRKLSSKWPLSNRKMMGEHSVAVVTGEEHRHIRKIVQQVFLPPRLSDYLPCIQEHIRSNLLWWCQRGQMLGFPACENLVTDVMTEVLFGFRKDDDEGRVVRNAAVTMNNNLFCLPFEFPGGGMKKAMDARQKIIDFVKACLEGRANKDHVSMMDILLTHLGTPDGMTDQQLMDNLVTLMMTGSGTTSGALCLSLMHLGRNPDVVEKIRAELDQLGLLDKDIDQSLSYDILQKLDYVHCVEKEVLRLTPPVGGAFRKANEEFETMEYLIPKDWTVIYSIRDTHQTTEIFSDRDRFLPDRWKDKELENQLRGQDSCSYMPFGFGSRKCVGRQLARMILHIFLVESVRLVKWNLHNPNSSLVFLPVTMPKDFLPVTFTQIT